ncbi:hypothetical protein D3C73_1418680 [compost metagenome]
MAGLYGLPGCLHLRIAAGRIDGDGGSLTQVLCQPVQLIFLQGNKRRNHDGGSARFVVKVQRCDLVGSRFSVTGGHNGQDITPLDEGGHASELALS